MLYHAPINLSIIFAKSPKYFGLSLIIEPNNFTIALVSSFPSRSAISLTSDYLFQYTLKRLTSEINYMSGYLLAISDLNTPPIYVAPYLALMFSGI